MKLLMQVLLLPLLGLILSSFNYNRHIDYSEINYIEYKKLKLKNLNLKGVCLTSNIKIEEVDQSNINDRSLLPTDEKSVVEKYNRDWYLEDVNYSYKGKVYKGIGGKDFKVNNKEIFTILHKTEDGFLIPYFTEKYKEEGKNYYSIFLMGIAYFSYSKENIFPILGAEDLNKYQKYKGSNNYRFLDVKGEWIFVLEVYPSEKNIMGMEEEYHHFRIYKFNILTKEVRIWDSRENGDLVMFTQTYYLNYDLSKDRRYLYMSFVNDGVYMFDWWEEKLYKIYNCPSFEEFQQATGLVVKGPASRVPNVINNSDDGYVYVVVYNLSGIPRKYLYYRFKNPEESLKK